MFGGLGFDDGIKYIPLDILVDIAMLIGLKDIELTQKTLIKEIRRVWSGKNLNLRADILHYLESIHFEFNPQSTNEEKNKKDKIETIFKQLDINDDEKKELIIILDTIKSRAIDTQTIQARLKTLRENKKIIDLFKDYIVHIEQSYIVISKEYIYTIENIDYSYLISLHFTKDTLLSDLKDEIDISVEFDKENHNTIREFENSKDDLISLLYKEYKEYGITKDTISKIVTDRAIFDIVETKELKLSTKAYKRITKKLNKDVSELKSQKNREELLARTIRDFKNLFPLARTIKRELIFYTGPTNSGKTYQAMQHLLKADTGFYLAPLRLLALEGYEYLVENGIDASLITGEEQILNDEAWHISSTIEMLNFNLDVDVCVIDEVQMINDRDRGWAWTNAIIGVGAKKVIMTGSKDALEAITILANWLGEKLTVVEFTRKNQLEVLPHHIDIEKIPPKSAIVAFSRKDVLNIKQQLSHKYNVSVVYGNLSPEVRREEARRFRNNQTDILVSTDAIAMGLNLPIQTIIFAKDSKFDGEDRRKLTTSEILQISGRAGRYGHHEKGYISALSNKILNTIKEKFYEPLQTIKPPFSVMASLEHVELISKILNTKKLAYILDFFGSNMEFDGPFLAKNIDSMVELATIVDDFELDLRSKFNLSCAPMTLSSPYLTRVFLSYASAIEKNDFIPYYQIKSLPMYASSSEELLKVEDMVKEITMYLWLSFKFENFIDTQKAKDTRDVLNKFIENSLKHSQFIRKCDSCGNNIPPKSKHNICDKCFRKHIKRR